MKIDFQVTGLGVTTRTCTKENPCCLHHIKPHEEWDECCGYCTGDWKNE